MNQMKCIPFILLILACVKDSGTHHVFKVEVWFMSFTVDTRVPVTIENIRATSSAKFVSITDTTKIERVEETLRELEKTKDSTHIRGNIRLLAFVEYNDKQIDTLFVDQTKSMICYKGKGYPYDGKVVTLFLSFFQ
jgi:hypothetical protein